MPVISRTLFIQSSVYLEINLKPVVIFKYMQINLLSKYFVKMQWFCCHCENKYCYFVWKILNALNLSKYIVAFFHHFLTLQCVEKNLFVKWSEEYSRFFFFCFQFGMFFFYCRYSEGRNNWRTILSKWVTERVFFGTGEVKSTFIKFKCIDCMLSSIVVSLVKSYY